MTDDLGVPKLDNPVVGPDHLSSVLDDVLIEMRNSIRIFTTETYEDLRRQAAGAITEMVAIKRKEHNDAQASP